MRRLLKAVLKTGSGTAGLLVFGIVATKIMALVLGPAGIGILSLLRQIRQMALTLGTISGSTALVQGIASRHGSNRDAYIQTVFCIFLISGIFSCLGIVFYAAEIATLVLDRDDAEAVSLIRWLALPVFLNVLLVFFSGLLNGYRAIGRLAIVGVVGAFFLALIAYPAAKSVENGDLLAFVWMMTGSVAAALFAAIYFLWRGGWLVIKLKNTVHGLKLTAAQHFFSVAGTMLIANIAMTGALLAARAMITHKLGLSSAGIFDVAWTLSMMYVTIITQSFGAYYLPTLSGVSDSSERLHLIGRVFRLALLLVTPVVVAVVVLKPLVINLLYSPDFMPSLETIRWMLIGDYFKVMGWVLAFTILAFTDMRTFFWSEVMFAVFLLVGAYVSVMQWGIVEGVGTTFTALYAVYFLFTLIYCKIRHGFMLSRSMMWNFLVGLALVLVASFYNWDVVDVNYFTSVAWIAAACLVSWLSLGCSEKKAIIFMLHKLNIRKKPYV